MPANGRPEARRPIGCANQPIELPFEFSSSFGWGEPGFRSSPLSVGAAGTGVSTLGFSAWHCSSLPVLDAVSVWIRGPIDMRLVSTLPHLMLHSALACSESLARMGPKSHTALAFKFEFIAASSIRRLWYEYYH